MLRKLNPQFYLDLDDRYDPLFFSNDLKSFKRYYYMSFFPDTDLEDFVTVMVKFCRLDTPKDELYSLYEKMYRIINCRPFTSLGTEFQRAVSRTVEKCDTLDDIEALALVNLNLPSHIPIPFDLPPIKLDDLDGLYPSFSGAYNDPRIITEMPDGTPTVSEIDRHFINAIRAREMSQQ